MHAIQLLIQSALFLAWTFQQMLCQMHIKHFIYQGCTSLTNTAKSISSQTCEWKYNQCVMGLLKLEIYSIQ